MQSIEKSGAWEPSQESIKTPVALYQKTKVYSRVCVCVGGTRTKFWMCEVLSDCVLVTWGHHGKDLSLRPMGNGNTISERQKSLPLDYVKMLIVCAENVRHSPLSLGVYSLKTSPLWRQLLLRLATAVSVSPLRALTPCLSPWISMSPYAAACNNLTSLFSCIQQACWVSSVRWLLSQIIPPSRPSFTVGLCISVLVVSSLAHLSRQVCPQSYAGGGTPLTKEGQKEEFGLSRYPLLERKYRYIRVERRWWK